MGKAYDSPATIDWHKTVHNTLFNPAEYPQ